MKRLANLMGSCGAILLTLALVGCGDGLQTVPGQDEQQEVFDHPASVNSHQDDLPSVGDGATRAATRAASSGEAQRRAHAQLGTNPYGAISCLKYVRSWAGLPPKYATTNAARQNYERKRVFRRGGNPGSAPKGAWLFYQWSSAGHVGMACDHGLIHQDNRRAVNYTVQHDSDRQFRTMPYLGYVTYDDAVRYW